MDWLPELLKQGTLGLVAGVFFWMYLQEKAERKDVQRELAEAQKAKDVLQEARRTDSVEMLQKVMGVAATLGDVQQILVDKIKTVKRGE